jgi:membrane-bound lytic murein transglycosylase
LQWIKDPDCTIYNARTRARAEANLQQKARAEVKAEHHWQKMQTTTTTKSSSSTSRRKRQRTDTSSSQEESGDDGEMMVLRELVQTQTTLSWTDPNMPIG